MGGTVLSQVVGYYVGNTNDFEEWGVNLTCSRRYWASFVLDLGSEWRPTHTRENPGDGSFVDQRIVGDSRGVGFWFIYGLRLKQAIWVI